MAANLTMCQILSKMANVSIDMGKAKIIGTGVERVFNAGSKREVRALGPLDLTIDEGEFVCLVGPSGCGKSTYLRVAAGLVAPTAGTVELHVAGRTGASTAVVFQDHGIFPWKTVEANVVFALRTAGVAKREAHDRAAFWLDRMQLSAFAKAYPSTLSGGMRQRVGIARALALEPEILLMDEPFAALDAQLRQVLQDELLAIWQSDRRTVLFITHSLDEALVLGDRVVVMSARPGRILESVDVPFPRPRDPAVRESADFGALRARLWDLLRSEIETGTRPDAEDAA